MADTTYLDDVAEEGFRLTTGAYLSSAAHIGLLTWLVMGWGLEQEPLPFETVNVSVVSTAEYESQFNQVQPEVEPIEPVALSTPEVETPPEVTQEDPVVPPSGEALPDVPEEEIPPQAVEEILPPQQVIDDVPVLEGPVVPETTAAPDLPVVDETPQVEEAPRIGSEVIAPPPPNVDVAPDVQTEASTESDSPEVIETETEATAPEEQTTEIVTEAETPSGAVEQAVRPPSRPERLVQVTEEAPVEEPVEEPVAPVEDTTGSAVDDLLSGLDSETPAADPVGDPGPPMTGGERDAFRVAVQGCWVVDAGSLAATVEVVVGFSLGRDGRVVDNRVEMISNSGGNNNAVNAAFEAARRAVLRCQGTGYDLPDEKYEQWRNVELVFNPDGMRLR